MSAVMLKSRKKLVSSSLKQAEAGGERNKSMNLAEQLLFTLCSHHVIRPNPLVRMTSSTG